MYKIFLSLLVGFFLVSCNKNDDGSVRIMPVKGDTFYPIKTSNISLDNLYYRYITANNSKYWVASDTDKNIVFGIINPDGSSEKIATIEDYVGADIDGLAIYKNYIIVLRSQPNYVVSYKIDDNLSVEKLATNTLSTIYSHSTSCSLPSLSMSEGIIAIPQQRKYIDINTSKVSQRNEVAIFRLDDNGSVYKVQNIEDITSDLSMCFGDNVALSRDILAISDTKGNVYIYQKDKNTTFKHTDTITLNLSHYGNYIDLALDGDFLVLHAMYTKNVYIYKLENGKVKEYKTVVENDIYKDYRARLKIYKDTILLNLNNGVSVYKIDSNSTQFYTSKFLDINSSGILTSFFETNFILFKKGSLHIYDTNPLDKIYLHNSSDINLSIYENETYNLFYVDASTMNIPLEYALSGSDNSYFKMINNKLYTYAKDSLDYENPMGKDMNNSYSFDINVLDAKQNRAKITMNIKVLDSEYFLRQRVLNSVNNKYFGKSLDLDGYDLVVGKTKGVELFKVNSDTLKKNFTISSDIYSFGSSVSKNSTNLLVGADSEDIDFFDEGAVYFYKLDDNITKVISQVKITGATPKSEKHFGSRVIIDDKMAVVSATGNYKLNGEVFVYDVEKNATLTLKQTLISNQSRASDFFGSSLALSDKYLFIGSPKEQFEGNYAYSGSVYMYKRDDNNTLTLVDILTPDKADIRQYFGNSMAMDGNYIVIGADEDNSIYIYKISISGEHADRIAKIQNANVSHFGLSVGINSKDITVCGVEDRETIYHYKIDNNDNVALKEVITDHEDKPIDSYERELTMGGNVFVVSSESFDINDTASGIISLFVKEK